MGLAGQVDAHGENEAMAVEDLDVGAEDGPHLSPRVMLPARYSELMVSPLVSGLLAEQRYSLQETCFLRGPHASHAISARALAPFPARRALSRLRRA